MHEFEKLILDERGTEALAAALARMLAAGDVVALNGPLGAGKTTFVRAMAGGLGIDPRQVVSPTFVLVQQYQGNLPVYHFDAYRLRDANEFAELGWEEYLQGQGICVIEWAARVAGALPKEHLDVEIEVTGPESRRIRLVAHGTRYEQMLENLAGTG